MSPEQIDGLRPGPWRKYVPGVYNYCDRWCERCRFQSRCVLQVMRVRRREAEARGEPPPTDSLPDDYPGRDDPTPRPWLDELLAAMNRPLTEAELKEMERQDEERERLLESDPLVIDAREYGSLADRIAMALEGELRGRGDPVVLAALDAIARHAPGISAKTWRAANGRILDAFQGADDGDEAQSDANGSAKVVRMMIAESRECWTVLMQIGRATADGLPVRMVERLDRLDQALAARFPRATEFVRPGFDEEP